MENDLKIAYTQIQWVAAKVNPKNITQCVVKKTGILNPS